MLKAAQGTIGFRVMKVKAMRPIGLPLPNWHSLTLENWILRSGSRYLLLGAWFWIWCFQVLSRMSRCTDFKLLGRLPSFHYLFINHFTCVPISWNQKKNKKFTGMCVCASCVFRRMTFFTTFIIVQFLKCYQVWLTWTSDMLLCWHSTFL